MSVASQNTKLDPLLEKQILKKINKVSYTRFKSIHGLDHINRNCLIFALAPEEGINLTLSTKEIDYLLQNSDLNHVDIHSTDALMAAARFVNQHSLCADLLNPDQWDYLIKNSNLKRIKNNWNSLMAILYQHKYYKLKLKSRSFNYLVESSDFLIDKGTSLSVLGLIAKNRPTLIKKAFTRALSTPKFNINDYKRDLFYKDIKSKMILIEAEITKKNIDKLLPTNNLNKNKKALKI